jgi:5-hydroxyisourate hydrolase
MSTVSTHVLDAGLGRPAPGVPVRLSRITGDETVVLTTRTTDADGRITEFEPGLEPGTYQLRFDIAEYATTSGQSIFFPEVTVTFAITDERHHHVPLLLSPFAYSTYRGS